MSLVELLAQADERSLAASGLACLDRCVPLLGEDDEVLRPLWAALAADEDWREPLGRARDVLGGAPEEGDEAAVLAHRMLGAVPEERASGPLREWADACSVAALQVHRLLDAVADGGRTVSARREGRTDDMSPLVAAELRRQTTILEVLSGRGAGGLRQALDLSAEGRRVLRAVVSRRARVRR
ncbi:hypothetical protein HUT18_22740 [Streptomyces sp. NA04227]|uniref:hypothetical protein n=1 Tax=Streptomyces sp. NA04227 TaxID=2742136 RepID=UPI001592356F|nr:hypothetical protein [Streptomyces sp. NA04227]QKW08772.1 hypothetical protein HUT18_22740 [Streptomyces sp. NA04227]